MPRGWVLRRPGGDGAVAAEAAGRTRTTTDAGRAGGADEAGGGRRGRGGRGGVPALVRYRRRAAPGAPSEVQRGSTERHRSGGFRSSAVRLRSSDDDAVVLCPAYMSGPASSRVIGGSVGVGTGVPGTRSSAPGARSHACRDEDSTARGTRRVVGVRRGSARASRSATAFWAATVMPCP